MVDVAKFQRYCKRGHDKLSPKGAYVVIKYGYTVYLCAQCCRDKNNQLYREGKAQPKSLRRSKDGQ